MVILIRLIVLKIKVGNQLQCITIQMEDLRTNENWELIQRFLEKDLDQMIQMAILSLRNYLEKFIIEVIKKIN